MQLRHDHSFGTVNDKGTVIGHQGNLTHVDFFFTDVLDRTGAGLFIVDHQTGLDAQRRGKGVTTQGAFFFVKGGLAQTIAHIFQDRVL